VGHLQPGRPVAPERRPDQPAALPLRREPGRARLRIRVLPDGRLPGQLHQRRPPARRRVRR
jgi:hypothetical protein